jgi:hypothetical protein
MYESKKKLAFDEGMCGQARAVGFENLQPR